MSCCNYTGPWRDHSWNICAQFCSLTEEECSYYVGRAVKVYQTDFWDGGTEASRETGPVRIIFAGVHKNEGESHNL